MKSQIMQDDVKRFAARQEIERAGACVETYNDDGMTVEPGNKRKSNRYFLRGSTQNLTGSTQHQDRGSKQAHEFNSVELNSKNGESAPVLLRAKTRSMAEIIHLDKERDRLEKERQDIRRKAETGLGGYSYTDTQRARIVEIKERIAAIDKATHIEL
jgi:hypothetical protein